MSELVIVTPEQWKHCALTIENVGFRLVDYQGGGSGRQFTDGSGKVVAEIIYLKGEEPILKVAEKFLPRIKNSPKKEELLATLVEITMDALQCKDKSPLQRTMLALMGAIDILSDGRVTREEYCGVVADKVTELTEQGRFDIKHRFTENGDFV